MSTPSIVSAIIVLIIAVSAIPLHRAASQEANPPICNPQVFAEIEAAFTDYRQANAEQDWKRLWNCHTKEFQDGLCFEMHFQCGMRSRDAAIIKILKSHGISDASFKAAYLKRHEEKHGIALTDHQQQNDADLTKQVLIELTKDRARFFKDVKTVITDADDTEPPFDELQSIAVDGKTAIGTANLILRVYDQNLQPTRTRSLMQIKFEYHNGRWLIADFISLPKPEPPRIGTQNGPSRTVIAPQY